MTATTETPPSPPAREPRPAPGAIRLATAVATLVQPLLGRARARELVGWAYAVLTLVAYSIQTQYARAFLGVLWTLIAPALLLAIYLPALTSKGVDPAWAALLGEGRLAFPIYVVIGFLVYGGFSQGLQNGASSLASSPEVVHHSPIPLSILPLVKVAQAVVGLVLSLVVVGVVIVATGSWPGARLLLLVPATLALFLVTLGFGLLFSVVSVLFRDMLHILASLLLVEFFAVPVIYLPSAVQGIQATIVQANPLTPILSLYRAGLIPSYPWSWTDLGLATAWALSAFVAGKLVFARLAPAVAEHA